MAGKLARLFFKQLAVNARMDVQWMLRDTRVFLVDVAVDLIGLLAAASGLFLLAERYGGIGGLTRDQLVFMLGYGLFTEGLARVFFGGENAGMPSRRFGRGQLDHMMIKPIPLWMQIVTDGFLPLSGAPPLFAGLAIVLAAAARMGLDITIAGAAVFLGQAFASMLVMVGFQYVCAVPALYAPVAAEEVATSVDNFFLSLRTFPLGGLNGALRISLCTVLPVGLLAWLPTAAMLGAASLALWVTPLAALLLIALAWALVARGIKYYLTVGSLRYSNRGFR